MSSAVVKHSFAKPAFIKQAFARYGAKTGLPLVVLAGLVAIALVLTGVGVYAVLTATANNATPQRATSGTLKLAMINNGVGFGTAISGLAPGDTVSRHVQLTNSGTLAGSNLTLAVVDATPTALSTNPTTGLQVAVARCSVPWVLATGTCSGSRTALLSTSVSALRAAPASVIPGVLAAGSINYLQVRVALPESTDLTVNGVLPAGTVQGLSAALTWTFRETQRTSTSTSG